MNPVELVSRLMMDAKQYTAELDKVTQKTSGWAKSLGGTIAKAGLAVAASATVAVGAAFAGVGVAATKTAMDFQQATSAIVVGTGASGEALAGMEQIVLNLSKTSAGLNATYGDMGKVVAEVNTRTGASGKILEMFSKRMMDYSRMAGTDAVQSTQLLTRVMGDWGLTMQDGFKLQDQLFGAAQAFGIGVDDLSRKVVQFGAPMRSMGFTVEESIALFGKWEQEGVNAELAIGSLRIAAGKFAREGVPLQEGLRNTMAAIKGAKNESEGLAIAMDVFGARAGPDMAAAIREGRFELDEAVKAVQSTNGALEDATKRSLTFSDKLQILKKRGLAAIMPLGEKILELAESAMPAVEKAFAWFEKQLPSIIEKVEWAMTGVIETVRLLITGDFRGGIFGLHEDDPFIGFLLTVRETILDRVIPAIQQFADWLINEGWPALRDFGTSVIEQLVPGLVLLGQTIWNIATTVWPYLSAAIQWCIDNMNILLPILAVVGIAILALTSPITLVIGAVVLLFTAWANNWGGIQEKTQAVLDFITPYIQAAMSTISNIVTSVLSSIQSWWQQHGDSVMTIVNFLFVTVVTLVKSQLQALWTTIKVVLALVQAFWKQWGDEIIVLTTVAWTLISEYVKTAMEVISLVIDLIAALIQGDWESFGDALVGIWKACWDFHQTVINSVKTILLTLVSGLADSIKSKWESFTSGLESTWSGAWDAIKGKIKSIVDPIIESIQGIINAIESAISKLKELAGISVPVPGIGSTDQGAPRGFDGSGASGAAGLVNNSFVQNNYYSGDGGRNDRGEFQMMAALAGST